MLIAISDVTYKGRTPKEDYTKLISFLDEVFFTDDDVETKRDFLGILPKLYKPEYDPCHNNFIVKEGDAIKGAVGLYYNTINAGGEMLRCGGIGNVAVHKDSRSKGYMIECMNLAMEDMKASKADFGLLGGQRQRYAYFSFEPAGVRYDFSVNVSNLRHCLGKDAENGLEVREVTAADTEVLAGIDAIICNESYYAIHPPEQMYDILCSWRNKPYAAFKDGKLKGFFTLNSEGGLSTFKAVDPESIDQMVLAVFETVQDTGISFSVAPYDIDCLDHFTKIAESCSIRHAECYTVINFANTVRGLLKVKAATEPMVDGSINLLIHGYAGDEQIKISHQGNEVDVVATTDEPDMELGHHEAIRLLFSLSSTERRNMTMNAEQWFPLPMHCFGFDSV